MTQEITEEFLTQLFAVIEAIADERIEQALTYDKSMNVDKMKQDLINIFAFGDDV